MFVADPSIPLLFAPTPWNVAGQALVIVGHLSRRAARALAGHPRGFAAPPLLGSVAVLGLISYTDTPVGPYHELAFTPGVLWRDIPAALVSHMLVDSARSKMAGRALWGLPKELARFIWQEGHITVATLSDDVLLDAAWQARGDWPRLAFPPLPAMTLRGPRRQFFTVSGWAGGVQRARVRLTLPPDSPFAPLAALTRGPHLALYLHRFRLHIGNAFDLM